MKVPIAFGKYHLLERVNVGGMAEVFKAKAFGVEGFERLLAVKRILPNIAEDKEFIQMFIDEAKIAVQLTHANICQIFDLGKVEDAYFIALEFVHGKDLRAIFDRCRQRPVDGSVTMPIAQSCFVIMKVCEGLDYAHNKRDSHGNELHLVHRDISPQNIILSYEGEVKLIDFGIAKAAGKVSKTQAGILKGKFGYMSPEQVRGLPLDRRSDIFSVGIVLYELLTGERLFIAESDFSTLEKVRNVEILPPSTYNRKIPEELERIVLKALAKDVEDRYQNAIDLHDDLQAFMYGVGEFFARKDLAAWMKRTFAEELAAEHRKDDAEPPVDPIAARAPAIPETIVRDALRPPPPPFGLVTSGPAMPAGRRGTPSGGQSVSALALAHSPMTAHAALPLQTTVEEIALDWDEDNDTQVYDNVTDPDPEEVRADREPTVSTVVTLSPQPRERDARPSASRLRKATRPGIGEQAWAGQTTDTRGPQRTPLSAEVTQMTPGALQRTPLRPDTERTRRGTSAVRPLIVAGIVLAIIVGVLGLFAARLRSQPWAAVRLDTAPLKDVRVLVDDQPAVPAPRGGWLRLAPGRHTLAVERSGYQSWHEQVELAPGAELTLRATLSPLPTAALHLSSEPAGAVAVVDGVKLPQKTPCQIERLAPGDHQIELQLPQYESWLTNISIRPGETRSIQQMLKPLSEPHPSTPKPTTSAIRVRGLPRLPILPENSLLANAKDDTPATPQAVGYLAVTARPFFVCIHIDGEDTHLCTPQRQIPLDPGRHRVKLVNAEKKFEKTMGVTIISGKTERIDYVAIEE